MLKDYHHFKGEGLSRAEKIQRAITQMLQNSNLPDDKRESSIVWEHKHSASCCQVGRILAEKRNLDIGLAEIICVLHDVYVILEGKYKDHAQKGAVIAKKLLEESGDFTPEEIGLITEGIAHHSEKEVYTGNPYVELAKDADVMDCSLYENVEGFYKIHKSKEVFDEYVKRIKKVRAELGLNPEKVFRSSK